MWQVFLSLDVEDFLKKLDSHIAERIKNSLKKLKTENPFHYIEHFEDKNYYIVNHINS